MQEGGRYFFPSVAESYLVEWVRDQVLNRDFERMGTYFSPGGRRGVTEKWKDVPRQLEKDGELSGTPDLGKQFWEDWLQLIRYRDGLIHARASLPDGSEVSPDDAPFPTGKDLADLEPGWAIATTLRMVSQFHDAAGMKLPDWLEGPVSKYVT